MIFLSRGLGFDMVQNRQLKSDKYQRLSYSYGTHYPLHVAFVASINQNCELFGYPLKFVKATYRAIDVTDTYPF